MKELVHFDGETSSNLAVYHVRDHHDLIDGGIGELQRQFGGFDVEGENNGIGMNEEVLSQSQSRGTPSTESGKKKGEGGGL